MIHHLHIIIFVPVIRSGRGHGSSSASSSRWHALGLLKCKRGVDVGQGHRGTLHRAAVAAVAMVRSGPSSSSSFVGLRVW
ncbi:hypothetical protein BGW80DRAFT_1443757 [Lactifluus volemus]|nr:hypothetical protein BGW80DRAFT_1443757 [Lactifluus volemus]